MMMAMMVALLIHMYAYHTNSDRKKVPVCASLVGYSRRFDKNSHHLVVSVVCVN